MTADAADWDADKFYAAPPDGWVCFHCGERFTTPNDARDHFGFEPWECSPACQISLGQARYGLRQVRCLERDLKRARDAAFTLAEMPPGGSAESVRSSANQLYDLIDATIGHINDSLDALTKRSNPL